MKTNFGLLRKLEHGCKDKEILMQFVLEEKKAAKMLACTLLALNLPSYLEMFYDKEQEIKPHPLLEEATDSCVKTVGEIVRALECGEVFSKELCCSVIAQRDANIRHMQLLSAFADRFTVYEYVLNRLEHRFDGKTLEKGYSDEEETEHLLSGLSAMEDQSARQGIIVQMVEQLPMRMTKKRFFQILAEGLDAYTGSEEKTVEDLLYMIKTAALLEEPVGMKEDYQSLYRIAVLLTEADYTNLDAAGFERLYRNVKAGLEELNRQMDLVMQLQEVLNELAVLVYAKEACEGCGEAESKPEISSCLNVVSQTLECFKHTHSLAETLYHDFEQLEGLQEEAYTSFSELSAAAGEYAQAYAKELAELGIESEFVSLERIDRLLSSSRFAVLAMEEAGKIADEAYITGVYETLYKELSVQFKKLPRVMNRAIMAKVVTMLPLFIRDYTQLEEYIRTSLSSCSDVAEKTACIEIMHELLGE